MWVCMHRRMGSVGLGGGLKCVWVCAHKGLLGGGNEGGSINMWREVCGHAGVRVESQSAYMTMYMRRPSTPPPTCASVHSRPESKRADLSSCLSIVPPPSASIELNTARSLD